jgi:hypothetical protein
LIVPDEYERRGLNDLGPACRQFNLQVMETPQNPPRGQKESRPPCMSAALLLLAREDNSGVQAHARIIDKGSPVYLAHIHLGNFACRNYANCRDRI